jgi:hypothetical protein
MIKINHNRFILMALLVLNSFPCCGTDARVENSFPPLKRARPHSLDSSSDESESHSYKNKKIKSNDFDFKPLSLPQPTQKNNFVLKIAYYARIADGLTFASTCRDFVVSLNDEDLWKDYVYRIPGHQAFLGERANKNEKGFYKSLFQKLMRPYFCPLMIKSETVCSEVFALSNQGLTFWGSITNSNLTDSQDEEESEDTGEYNNILDQATFWQEGVPRFVSTQRDVFGSYILGASDNNKFLVGSYQNDLSTTSTKAAFWTRTSSGDYQMFSLPDDEAEESIAKAVNQKGKKIAGVLYTPSPQAVVWEDNELSYLEVPEDIISSFATCIDASGDRIVGLVENRSKRTLAGLWLNKRWVQLPPHPLGHEDFVARVISADGTTIAGYTQLKNNNDNIVTEIATVWTSRQSSAFAPPISENSSVRILLLESLCEDTHQNFPQALDAKGNRIVGYDLVSLSQQSYISPEIENSNKSRQRAVIWMQTIPHRFDVFLLQKLLGSAVPQNYILNEATCIDGTGTLIGGNGYPSAWLAYLPDAQSLLSEGISRKTLFPSLLSTENNTLLNNKNSV